MEHEFVTPQEALARLRSLHYRGGRKAKSSDLAIRLPLLGALRAGEISWRAARWREWFVSDREASFDAAGGWTSEVPVWWPADFWQPGIAARDEDWRLGCFQSRGDVTQRTAPYKVRLWLERNGESRADWFRSAEGVEFDWAAAARILSGAGWQSWSSHHAETEVPGKLAWHYREGYENLITLALQQPGRFETEPLFALIEEAFDLPPYRDGRGKWMGGGIDDAEIKRIARALRLKMNDDEDVPPP